MAGGSCDWLGGSDSDGELEEDPLEFLEAKTADHTGNTCAAGDSGQALQVSSSRNLVVDESGVNSDDDMFDPFEAVAPVNGHAAAVGLMSQANADSAAPAVTGSHHEPAGVGESSESHCHGSASSTAADVAVAAADDGAQNGELQDQGMVHTAAATKPSWWLQAVRDVLGPKFEERRLPDELLYGSDCSGVDAPLWALSRLLSDIQAYSGKSAKLVYKFASEAPGAAGLWQKQALLLNTPAPEIIFDDLLARTKATGVDWVSEKKVAVPAVEIYTGGFECQDLSCLNTSRKALDLNLTQESGMSSKTLKSSLQYIKTHKPAYVCVENVARRDTGTVVQKELEQLGYLVQVFFANACQFGVCQSRSRVYIAGVLREKVRVVYGPDCWSRWLEEISQIAAKSGPGFTELMLPDDDPRVVAALEARRGSEMPEDDLRAALSKGESWPKCFAKHQEARKSMAERLGVEVPNAESLLGIYGNEWSRTLPAREQDVLYLHLWMLEKHRGSTDFPLIWDLTHNIQFSNWKEAEHQEFLPCLLRGHRYWHVGRGRMILGCELLRGQGFPATFKASGSTAKEDDVKIPDIQLNRIAGNSIAIPAIGSIIAILLACTEMISSRSGLKSPSPRRRQHHADSTEPVWVGLGRVAARAGKFDCLLPSNKLKKRTLNSKEDDQQTLDRFVQRKAGKAEKCERQ